MRNSETAYLPQLDRYDSMVYNRCGNSGLKLPAISLGLWHNFGEMTVLDTSREMMRTAFDLGITHFDLANNYGPPAGSAEETFGMLLKSDFAAYRDEMVISTKAGYTMWPGPYGDWGSKKYLVSSLDQSLRRMQLDYVDIFYHHRPDPETPMEETMRALDLIVRQGKALYIGLSNYNPQQTIEALDILRQLGTPCIIHQSRYSMLSRENEDGLLDVLGENGIGCIAFAPLAGGRLSERYLNGIPSDSRAASGSIFLKEQDITDEMVGKVRMLNEMAVQRGQKLSQMALSWLLKDKRVTSVLIGASKPEQILECAKAIENVSYSWDELDRIDNILSGKA